MKNFPVILTVLLLLFAVVPVALAQDSPVPPDPVDDIALDLESLPDYFGLGAVVALLTMVLRFAGIPNGWGGKTSLIVGALAFVTSKILPADQRDTFFEAANNLAAFFTIVLSSQLTHLGSKYAGLSWWKRKDTGEGD